MDEDVENSTQILTSVMQINDRVLGFQNYAMRRVWGVLFGLVAILILVDTAFLPLISYFIKPDYWISTLNLVVQVGTFFLVIFYWFRLFENSARIVKLRKYTKQNHSHLSIGNAKNWRNTIIMLFILCIFAAIALDTSAISQKGAISNIIFMVIYLVFDIILLKGLLNTFVKVPIEGCAVFFSYFVLVIFSIFNSIANTYISATKMNEIAAYLIVGVVLSILLLSSFSFIYHAPDYLEGLNEQ